MLKISLIAGLIVVGAAVSTALAVTASGVRQPQAPHALIDPTALTLQARNLPVIAVDKAF